MKPELLQGMMMVDRDMLYVGAHRFAADALGRHSRDATGVPLDMSTPSGQLSGYVSR